MRVFRLALGSLVVFALVFAGLAAASAPVSAQKKKCKVVTKVIKGKKKKVRVCHTIRPKPGGGTIKPPPPPPPPPPRPAPGTQQNPVPVGAVAQIGDGWRLVVDWADPNQTQAILDAQRGDPDNLPEPPLPGFQYLLARVTVTRTAEPASFSPYSLDLLADDGTLYDDAGPACGTLLDGLDATEVPDGEKATGTVCWKLASADVRKVVMFYTDPFSGESIYFSLGL